VLNKLRYEKILAQPNWGLILNMDGMILTENYFELSPTFALTSLLQGSSPLARRTNF
jgi:hypothetical protein